jgi:peptidoglycan/xylan/chitin deacetylase (PgdA/CDA1 family)
LPILRHSRHDFVGRLLSLVVAPAILGLSVAGCHRRAPANPAPQAPLHLHPSKPAPPPLTSDQLKIAHPNEAGWIPILLYQNIATPPPGRSAAAYRTPDQFRKDLERLYKENYRPITMDELLDNKIGIGYGMKPVILTFDDSLPSQFQYRSDGSIDPNCAVGIMQTFSQAHPDFPVKAVFYVLPDRAFGVEEEAGKKLQALVDMGCELGNHTVTRHNLRNMSDQQVQHELAGAVAKIKAMAPKARVDTLALPLGRSARNSAVEKDGVADGVRYHNRAALLIGAQPASVPYAKSFKPLRVPRILAVEGLGGITYWLDFLSENHRNFISDGDATITTIPKSLMDKIDKSKLNGAALRPD